MMMMIRARNYVQKSETDDAIIIRTTALLYALCTQDVAFRYFIFFMFKTEIN